MRVLLQDYMLRMKGTDCWFSCGSHSGNRSQVMALKGDAKISKNSCGIFLSSCLNMCFLYIKSVGGVICVWKICIYRTYVWLLHWLLLRLISIMGIRLRCPVNLPFIRFTGHQENGLKITYNKINYKQAKMFCKEERSKENS